MTKAKKNQIRQAGQAWRGREDQGVNELVLEFSAGRDVTPRSPVDEALFPYDLWNTEAHDIMLWKKRVIPKKDLVQILGALEEIRGEWTSGHFQLDPALEDVHMNIESRITQKIGARAGGKVHTGRSRNDQVATDMRMFLREQVLLFEEDVLALFKALLDQAGQHLETVLPGQTHRRPAMITTVAHWLAAQCQALERDLERMEFTYRQINRSPLGAAASFGTSWPLDRLMTADLLGFDAVEENTLDCITHRWESEAAVADVLVFLLNHCANLAQDLILFSMQDTQWVKLPDAFTTGSSIMPQKRNPDFAELILGKAAVAQGAWTTLVSLGRGLPSGYNRETQLGKQTVVELVEDVRLAPKVLAGVVRQLQFDEGKLRKAAEEGFLNAVDVADYLVQKFGVSFREAYGMVARAIDPGKKRISRDRLEKDLAAAGVEGKIMGQDFEALHDPTANLSRRKHLGSPSPKAVREHLGRLKKSLGQHTLWLRDRRRGLLEARDKLDGIRRELGVLK
jgi:argininosuccinate lyase